MPFPQVSCRLDYRLLLSGIAAWALAALVFFRQAFSTSFAQVFGNVYDGSLIVYTHEHLYRALLGQAQFLSPPFFYPQSNVLGFTDGFLLNIAPYALLRTLGFDAFLSMQIMLMLLSLLCFTALLLICTRYLGAHPVIALCAATLVAFPNNLFFRATVGHINFFALYYVPAIALLALWGLEEFPRQTMRSQIRVAAAAFAFALLFSTAFYIAWFVAITTMIAAGTAWILLRHHAGKWARAHARPVGTVLAAAAGGFAIGIIPLFWIYLPVLNIAPSRTWREYITFAPTIKDLINFSTGNLFWGWTTRIFSLAHGHEHHNAITPILTVAAIVLTFRLRQRERASGVTSWQSVFAMSCIVTWLASWLLTIKIGTVSLFWLPFQAIPAASVIRSGGRIQLVVNIWLVLAFAVLLTNWIQTAPVALKARTKALAASIVLLCLAEQFNRLDAAQLPRAGMLQWLASMRMPPAECEAFLVDSRADAPENRFYVTDAMWITLKTRLPTLNGMSGSHPPGWRIQQPIADYFGAAREWIALKNMKERVCLYDRAAGVWSRFD